MELVPILSMIVLVGTIATFILAVFAYITYKVREHRYARSLERPVAETGEAKPPAPAWAQAPALENAIAAPPACGYPEPPAHAPKVEEEPSQAAEEPQAAANAPSTRRNPDSLFWEYTGEGFVPVDPKLPEEGGRWGDAWM